MMLAHLHVNLHMNLHMNLLEICILFVSYGAISLFDALALTFR